MAIKQIWDRLWSGKKPPEATALAPIPEPPQEKVRVSVVDLLQTGRAVWMNANT